MVTMIDFGGLSLVGTRAPSATGSRPSSGTGYHYPPSPKTTKPYNGSAYEDRIFGATTSAPGNQTYTTSQPRKGRASYVDETLFGSPEPVRNQEPSHQSPWQQDKKSKPLLHDGTDYRQAKAMLSGRSTPKKSMTPSARRPHSRTRSRNKHTPSFVDESLFGPRPEEPSFASPWDPSGGKNPKTVFDATDYKAVAERKAVKEAALRDGSSSSRSAATWRPPSARPGSASSSRPSSRQTTRLPKNTHQSSYADESLFGPKLAEPSFPAPWENTRQKKPDLFSTTDYKAGVSAREKRRQDSARGDQRPAWK